MISWRARVLERRAGAGLLVAGAATAGGEDNGGVPPLVCGVEHTGAPLAAPLLPGLDALPVDAEEAGASR